VTQGQGVEWVGHDGAVGCSIGFPSSTPCHKAAIQEELAFMKGRKLEHRVMTAYRNFVHEVLGSTAVETKG
jgi:hypothetical protein